MAVIKPEDTTPVQAVQPLSGNGAGSLGQTHSVPAGVLDFSDLRAKRQLLVAASGAEKSGKTWWSLRHGPGDAYLVVLDPNSVEIAKKAQAEIVAEGGSRRIHYKDFQWGTRIDQDPAMKLWLGVKEFVQWACSHPNGTVVFDTETAFKKLTDYAFVGPSFRLRENERIDRSQERNDGLIEVINIIRKSGLSGVFLQRLGEKWGNVNGSRQPTGEMEVKGWGELPYNVTTIMRFWFDPATPPPASPFRAYIGLHGPNPDYAGTEWYRGQPPEDDPEGGWLDFARLLDLTFGPE